MAVNTRAGLSCAAAPPKSVPANAKTNSTRFIERSLALSNGRPYFDHSNVHGRANEHVVDTRTSTRIFDRFRSLVTRPEPISSPFGLCRKACMGDCRKAYFAPAVIVLETDDESIEDAGSISPEALHHGCHAGRERDVFGDPARGRQRPALLETDDFVDRQPRPGRTGTGTPAPRGSAIAPAARSAAA